jgi:DhnA family fructose-bisphosphate aldolase class Ia
MLVEMARADGRIEEQERLFFEHFLNEETGRLADLMRAPVLTPKDCKEVTANVRSTIFMLVAAVALTDNEFNERERQQLDRFARLLNFEEAEQLELLSVAQTYTIEVAYKAQKGNLSTEELYTIANQIGMHEDAAATAYQSIARRNV